MKVGEIYLVAPVFSIPEGSGNFQRRKMKGRVVYVHPLGRFAVLAFPGAKGTSRESFWPEELTEANRVAGRKRGKK